MVHTMFNFFFSMNAGVGLISFPKNIFNETFANKTVSADNIINLVKTLMADIDADEDDSVACPWYEIGQEPIVLANQQVKGGSKMPVEVLFMKMNEKMVFQYRIFSFGIIEVQDNVGVQFVQGTLQYFF